MLRDFPSLMIIQIHPRVPDPTTAKRLIGNMLSLLQEAGKIARCYTHQSLRNNVSKTVFTDIPSLKQVCLKYKPWISDVCTVVHTLYWSIKHGVCNQPVSGFITSLARPNSTALIFVFNTALFCISSSGSTGVFCEIRSDDRRMLKFLRTLGLLQTLTMEGLQAGVAIVGTKLWIMIWGWWI